METQTQGPRSVSHLRIDELLARISGSDISPGSGAAGAVALALAAACASKAVSISLKHNPDNSELLAARVRFRLVASVALADGDRDSDAFEAFVHERRTANLKELVTEGERFNDLIVAFTGAIDAIEQQVQPNMAGDMFAARALAAAARQIQERNESELLMLR